MVGVSRWSLSGGCLHGVPSSLLSGSGQVRRFGSVGVSARVVDGVRG